jgi:hypothetical protein
LRGRITSIALGAVAALWASAASAEDAAECRGFPSALDKVSVMQVTGSGPAHFFEAWVEGCERSAEHCQKRSYVVPGDRVLAEDADAGFFCAWYLDGKGRESWGLLPARRLAPAAVQERAPGDLAAWSGRWNMVGVATTRSRGEDDLSPTADIAIVAGGHRLKAAGDASYPYRDGLGELTANVGQFGEGGQDDDGLTISGIALHGAEATPKGGLATFVEEDCRIQMRRIGALLMVVDNGECGGMNVTFSGFYRRVGPVPATGAKR